MTLTIQDRIALAREALSEGRIIQGEWHRSPPGDGKELVCALAAFGEPGEINSPRDCPAELMPEWLAGLVPTLDDGIAETDVPWFVGELVRCAERWHVLDAAAWERVRTGFQIACIRQAVASAEPAQPDPRPAYWQQVVDACEGMIRGLYT